MWISTPLDSTLQDLSNGMLRTKTQWTNQKLCFLEVNVEERIPGSLHPCSLEAMHLYTNAPLHLYSNVPLHPRFQPQVLEPSSSNLSQKEGGRLHVLEPKSS